MFAAPRLPGKAKKAGKAKPKTPNGASGSSGPKVQPATDFNVDFRKSSFGRIMNLSTHRVRSLKDGTLEKTLNYLLSRLALAVRAYQKDTQEPVLTKSNPDLSSHSDTEIEEFYQQTYKDLKKKVEEIKYNTSDTSPYKDIDMSDPLIDIVTEGWNRFKAQSDTTRPERAESIMEDDQEETSDQSLQKLLSDSPPTPPRCESPTWSGSHTLGAITAAVNVQPPVKRRKALPHGKSKSSH
jgi:hypothetical protein